MSKPIRIGSKVMVILNCSADGTASTLTTSHDASVNILTPRGGQKTNGSIDL